MKQQQKELLTVGIGAAGLFVAWRQLRSTGGRSARASGPAVTSGTGGSIQPYTPQSPVTLQPGESVYDPNSEGLTNTPTAPFAGASVPLQTAAPSTPGYTVNVQYPATAAKTPAAKKPAQRPSYAPANARHTGTRSPGPGWRGIGGGWWAPPRKQASKPK